MPKTRARPHVGRMWSSSVRIVVVLPAPLGPRKPKASPSSTSRSTSTMPAMRPVGLGELLGLDDGRHGTVLRVGQSNHSWRRESDRRTGSDPAGAPRTRSQGVRMGIGRAGVTSSNETRWAWRAMNSSVVDWLSDEQERRRRPSPRDAGSPTANTPSALPWLEDASHDQGSASW